MSWPAATRSWSSPAFRASTLSASGRPTIEALSYSRCVTGRSWLFAIAATERRRRGWQAPNRGQRRETHGRMNGLPLEEVASRAGVEEEYVRRLEELGALEGRGEG